MTRVSKMSTMKTSIGFLSLILSLVFVTPAYAGINGSVTDFEASSWADSLRLKRVHVYEFPKANKKHKKRFYYKSPDYRYSVEVNCSINNDNIWMQSVSSPLPTTPEQTQTDKEVIIAFADEVTGGRISQKEFAAFVEASFEDHSGYLQKKTIGGYKVAMFVGEYIRQWAVDISQ